MVYIKHVVLFNNVCIEKILLIKFCSGVVNSGWVSGI